MKYNLIKKVIVKENDNIKEKIGWGDDFVILHTHRISEIELEVWVIAGDY
jgi:hypothetical protein